MEANRFPQEEKKIRKDFQSLKIPAKHQQLSKLKKNRDIKSVLKSIKQSNTIIQILETIEKPNIFDIESITSEHRKTVTKLLQPKNYHSAIKQNKNLRRIKSQ